MSWETVQHVAVTLIAVVAAGVLCRQVLAFLWPRQPQQPACANCASTKPSRRKSTVPEHSEPVIIQIRK